MKGMSKVRMLEGKFTTLLEQVESQDCVPRDNQCRYAKNVAASGPRKYRTPDTHPNRETSTEMAANSVRVYLCLRFLIRRYDVCLDHSTDMWGVSQP